jgi:putative CocE/NonD family hydrolase
VTEPWTLPPKVAFQVVEHTWIAMADGVRLSARLWLPDVPAAPVVLEYIPYRKADGYRGHDDLWGPQLAAHGVAYARVDVRGSGDSEGLITDEYSQAELDDGCQIIAWLAEQPWCNGAVGMRGISWGGINTLQVAARAPPALRAIMPMCCCDNRFTDDAHYIGGALGHTNFQWGAAFKAVMAGPPSPDIRGPGWRDAWLARLEAAPPILETWLSHQRFDAYWQRGSVALDPGAIVCPTYVVGGWSDTYNNSVGSLLERLTVPHKGLIGPWGHTYPYTATPLGLDWAVEEVRWWRHHLMGEATGIMDEPMLRVFMPHQTASRALPAATPGRWIAEPGWPSTAVKARELHLTPAGLTDEPGPGEAVTVHGGRVVGLTKPEWLDRLPGEQSADDEQSALFDTLPMADSVEILGRPTVHLRLAADQSVAHVAVRLTEVTPDGRSWLIAYALRNLTHRDGHADPKPLTPGQVCDVDLAMGLIAHRFNAGSRIRIAISESLWPLVWPSPRPATLTIDLAGSRLTLPVRSIESEPAPFTIPERHTPPSPDGKAPVLQTAPDPDGVYRLSGRGGSELSEIAPGDPSSCHWSQTRESAWRVGGADCRLIAAYDLTADERSFRLTESLTASCGGEVIFERTARANVPRDLA